MGGIYAHVVEGLTGIGHCALANESWGSWVLCLEVMRSGCDEKPGASGAICLGIDTFIGV